MVRINNTDLMNELRDVAKIQVGSDMIPNVMSNQVVPVIDVNPKHARIINLVESVSKSTTGAANVYTTPTSNDFFLCGVNSSFDKNVTCDLADGRLALVVTINGAEKVIIGHSVITLTAERGEIAVDFNRPIKLDRNTTIYMAGTFTAGKLLRQISIYGYIVDNSNA